MDCPFVEGVAGVRPRCAFAHVCVCVCVRVCVCVCVFVFVLPTFPFWPLVAIVVPVNVGVVAFKVAVVAVVADLAIDLQLVLPRARAGHFDHLQQGVQLSEAARAVGERGVQLACLLRFLPFKQAGALQVEVHPVLVGSGLAIGPGVRRNFAVAGNPRSFWKRGTPVAVAGKVSLRNGSSRAGATPRRSDWAKLLDVISSCAAGWHVRLSRALIVCNVALSRPAGGGGTEPFSYL